MIAKIAVFSTLLAIATAGIIGAPPPAVYAAGPAPIAYAAGPLGYAAAPLGYAAAPAVAYAAAPVAIPAPITYDAGVKVVHTYEPVEQHGYKIAY